MIIEDNDSLFDLKPFTHSLPEWDEYEVFHDESKDNRFVHGFLLIPVRVKQVILKEVSDYRAKFKCDDFKLHYNELTGQQESQKTKVVSRILLLMMDALRCKGYSRQLWGKIPPNCKFIFFKKKSLHRMEKAFFQGGVGEGKKEIDLRRIEVLMRIGLKGGLHYFFNESHKVRIVGMYTDGSPYHRALSRGRVVDRLRAELRHYIDFSSDLEITPLSSRHADVACRDKDRAQLLQVCDLLLGAFLYSIFPQNVQSQKYKVAAPVRNMMLKKQRGAGFLKSGHYKSYTVTRAMIENGRWNYVSMDDVDRGKLGADEQLFLW